MRSAASLGGNIALGRLKDLESDVITVFMGAGASVQVINISNNRSVHTSTYSSRQVTWSHCCTVLAPMSLPVMDGHSALTNAARCRQHACN